MKCDVCQKVITGNYLIYEGKNCCSQRCHHALCEKCQRCEKVLDGQYFIVTGKKYCSQTCAMGEAPATKTSMGGPTPTMTSREQCSVCSKPLIGQYFTLNGKTYCSQTCLSTVSTKCNNCNISLIGKFTKIVSDREYLYCMDCYQGIKCFGCGRPERGITLPDGRFVCHLCRKTGVIDKPMAQQLFNEVRIMVTKLGYTTCNAIEFHLTDRVMMKRVSGERYNDHELGLYHNLSQTSSVSLFGLIPLGGGETLSKSCAIYVYDNLAKERFMETVAHELGHDWCRHQFGKIVFSPACEGVAEYVASRFNEAMGWGRNNQRMQNNPDPIYGGGYRMIRNIAIRSGDNGVRLFMKDHLK